MHAPRPPTPDPPGRACSVGSHLEVSLSEGKGCTCPAGAKLLPPATPPPLRPASVQGSDSAGPDPSLPLLP